jgi:hypothetical protein
MTERRTGGDVQIVSEARGGHWVAWISRGGDRKPVGGVVVVGQTREEAERRADRWAAESGAAKPAAP